MHDNDRELPCFDTMLEMAQTNPEALETLRQRQVSALIQEAPEHIRQRLHGLQFQIDAQRQIYNNPMSACVKISHMMNESFAKLRLHLNQLSSNPYAQTPEDNTEPHSSTDKPTATVLVFPTDE